MKRIDISHPLPSSKAGNAKTVDIILRDIPLCPCCGCDGRPSVNSQSARCTSQSWYYPITAVPPPEYPYGPLQGTQKQLALWIAGNDDRRRLLALCNARTIWVKRLHYRCYEAWFRNQQRYSFANQQHLIEQAQSLGNSVETTRRS